MDQKSKETIMDQQRPIERDPLPESFATLAEAAEFWETHSSADYEDMMEEVFCVVNLTDKPIFAKSINVWRNEDRGHFEESSR